MHDALELGVNPEPQAGRAHVGADFREGAGFI
jgi:hypothetical protein